MPYRVRHNWWIIFPLSWMVVGALHAPGAWIGIAVILLVFGSGMLRVHSGHRDRYHRGALEPGEQRPSVDLRKNPPRVPATQASPPQRSLAGLARDNRLPRDLGERADRLDAACAQALTYLHERNADAAEVFEIDQIRTDFAPEAIQTYLALAPGSADTAVLTEGKTGHQLVAEQLDLLLAAVDERMTRAGRLGSEPLLANHRFLQRKFGKKPDDELTL